MNYKRHTHGPPALVCAKNPFVEDGELNALMGKVKKKAELAKEPSQS